jgi:polyhydroxybutyrate depolymerase
MAQPRFCSTLSITARCLSSLSSLQSTSLVAVLLLFGCDSGLVPDDNDGPASSGEGDSGGGGPSPTGGSGGSAFGESGGTAAGGASDAAGGSDMGAGSGGVPGDDADPSDGCGKPGSFAGESSHSIEVGGGTRTFIVRVPDDYDPEHPHRLMVAMHPYYGSASGVASGLVGTNYEYYGIWSRDDDKTIFISPQGNGDPAGWFNGGGSDEDFIMAVIEKLEDEMCIDSSRIFAEGFSFGGAMAYALACRFPDRFRAIAMHGGGPMSGCNQSSRGPVAFFMSHGIHDDVCIYPEYGVPQLNDFAEQNGCDPMDLPSPTDPTGSTPACVDFANCDSGYPTRACLFVGKHTPSPPNEETTWVPDETWKFIEQF